MPEGIEKRGRNSWSVRVYMGYDSRQKKRTYIRVTVRGTYKDAQRVRAELLRRRDEGRLGQARGTGRVTVAAYLERWLAMREGGLAPATVEGQRIVVQHHLVPVIGHLRLRELTPMDVQAVLLRARERGLGQGSVRNIHAVLRQALNDAVSMGLLPDNPCARVRPGVYRPRRPELPSPEGLARLLREVEGSPVGPAIALIAATGMRLGEALGLRWGDVDLERRLVQVRRTLSRTSGGVHERGAKAGSDRTIPIGDMACRALERQAAAWRQMMGREPSPGDYVFVREGGAPESARRVQYYLGQAAARLGMAGLRVHDLRHLVASLLLGHGVSVRVVAELLGHRVPSTTLDVYSHVLAGGSEEAMRLLDRLVGGEGRETGEALR
ncbi:MAG: tyrosine-type recombinase/integrase [Chloroflexota bacterium]|nr:tyrosine-type recombinase/integrase [Chloroflexota bacterium]